MKKIILLILTLIAIFIFIEIANNFGVDLIRRKSSKVQVILPKEKNDFEKSKMVIIPVNTVSSSISMEYAPEGKFLSEWKKEDGELIINGGYFHEDYSPSGYLMVNKERIGKRLFDENRSGLLTVQDGVFSIRNLQKEPLKKDESFEFALQSYPFIIKEGSGVIEKDSGLKARRTAVGLDKSGMAYIIIVPDKEISLYEFMNDLISTRIPFVSVLNLDGGPSTGVIGSWGESDFAINSFTKVANILKFKPL